MYFEESRWRLKIKKMEVVAHHRWYRKGTVMPIVPMFHALPDLVNRFKKYENQDTRNVSINVNGGSTDIDRLYGLDKINKKLDVRYWHRCY